MLPFKVCPFEKVAPRGFQDQTILPEDYVPHIPVGSVPPFSKKTHKLLLQSETVQIVKGARVLPQHLGRYHGATSSVMYHAWHVNYDINFI